MARHVPEKIDLVIAIQNHRAELLKRHVGRDTVRNVPEKIDLVIVIRTHQTKASETAYSRRCGPKRVVL